MTMENKVDYTFYRTDVERMAGRSLTDEEWEVMSGEIEYALDYYFNEDTPRLLEDIDSIVAEDRKARSQE
jgi:hypothetical protein